MLSIEAENSFDLSNKSFSSFSVSFKIEFNSAFL
jgi:hypothetical protein